MAMAGQQQDVQLKLPVRRLRGHTDSVLCCASRPDSPHVVASSSEDGSVCIFDIRTAMCCHRLQYFGGQAVVSVLPAPGSEHVLYAAAGSTVYCLDVRQGPTGSPLQTYSFNVEEINQVALNFKGTYLAAADDSGAVKVIDTRTHKVFKTLQGAHSNICSSVQFHSRRPWEVVTGGLDSKIVKWDFNRGRPLQVVDLAAAAVTCSEGVGGFCNPPFVHALASIEGDVPGEAGKLLAVARGDGAIDVFDSSLESSSPKQSSQPAVSKRRASTSKDVKRLDDKKNPSQMDALVPGRKRHLHLGIGGHGSIVNHVTFARFGQRGQFLVSGGNDTFIKVWDWALEDNPSSDIAATSSQNPLVMNLKHKRKVNWLSTTSSEVENLVVADTSKVLSIYSVF
ncbi:hypothetical protein M758_8G041800 [Ceratodon purpureus]|nr:hypothetical protein M758_8G041800 [Ceratodon purpureus]